MTARYVNLHFTYLLTYPINRIKALKWQLAATRAKLEGHITLVVEQQQGYECILHQHWLLLQGSYGTSHEVYQEFSRTSCSVFSLTSQDLVRRMYVLVLFSFNVVSATFEAHCYRTLHKMPFSM